MRRGARRAGIRWDRLALLAALGVAASTCVVPGGGPLGAATTGSDWTVYHGAADGSGVADEPNPITVGTPAWTSPTLDGDLYGEPLVSAGSIYVATENDTVYALDASDGAVRWSAHLGPPVPSSQLPCGDISPTVGVTGTPVIDPSRAEIFVVADLVIMGRPSHVLVGLRTATGAQELDVAVDPPGADPAALLQRTGLNLDDGKVVFGMGGNFGDCASYRGRVVAVNESGGSPSYFTVDAGAGQSQGAVWMGGAAPEVDAQGNIWVGVGNGSVHAGSEPYDDSDSVLELSPSLALEQYFAPSDWAQQNADDLDMSIAPALLGNGQVVLSGKARVAYLLDGSHLGGIGNEEASVPTGCAQDVDGGAATEGTTVFLPCQSGPVAMSVQSAPAGLRVLWRADVGGGPPIVAGGLVWTIGQDGRLYGLNPQTGAVEQSAEVGPPANHFPTPSVGDGLLLAPASDHVVAFGTPPASAATSTTSVDTTTSALRSSSPSPSRPGGDSDALALGVGGGAVVVLAATAEVLRRRRRRRTP